MAAKISYDFCKFYSFVIFIYFKLIFVSSVNQRLRFTFEHE